MKKILLMHSVWIYSTCQRTKQHLRHLWQRRRQGAHGARPGDPQSIGSGQPGESEEIGRELSEHAEEGWGRGEGR